MDIRRPRPDMPSREERKKARERGFELQNLQEEMAELQNDLKQAVMMGDKKSVERIRDQIRLTREAIGDEAPILPKLEKSPGISSESSHTLGEKRRKMIREAIESVEADERAPIEKLQPTADEYSDASVMMQYAKESSDLRGSFAAREREDRQKRLEEIMARVDKAYDEKVAAKRAGEDGQEAA